MRRTVSLVAVVTLGLAACSTGASAEASAEVPATAGTATATAPSTAASSDTAPTGETAPASEPVDSTGVVAAPAFTISTERRRDLPRYQRFRYQTAVATGMTPEAAASVDAAVARLVQAAVDRAVAKGEDDCLVGRGRCASFDATLTQLPCRDGYLCVLQEVSAIWPSAAIPYRTAETLVFDAATGEQVALTDVVPAAQMPAFLASVRERLDRFQRRHDIRGDDLPARLSPADLPSWAPLRRGIRVWFDEYVAAPGFFAVVPVRVPYPS